jgi:hypothetical protein
MQIAGHHRQVTFLLHGTKVIAASPPKTGDSLNFVTKKTRQCFFGNSWPPAFTPPVAFFGAAVY